MHKKIISLSFAFILCGSVMSVSALPEPINLAMVKKQLVAYHDSGQYQQDLAEKFNLAQKYLAMRVELNDKAPIKKKLAIVFDIDETTLSNYDNMKKEDFGGSLDSINASLAQGNDKAIAAALSLYQYAIANHVNVFFITGRKEFLRAATEKNLKAVGYTTWNQLILEPNDKKYASASVYKAAARKQIEVQGYDIVLNIGDQHSDLTGGFADKTIKLPNPYYFVG